MRRLSTLVLLVAIIIVGVYLWKARPGSPSLAESARGLDDEARDLGAQARDKLGVVGQKIEDVKVVASVKTALSLSRSLHPYSIEVGSKDGVVTLRGQVVGEPLRARAEAVAARVPDVARVVNEIVAAPGAAPAPAGDPTLGESLDNHTLQMQVKLALSLDRELKDSEIKVDVDRHEVTLSGEVANRAQGDRALEVARDTSSVEGVVDRMLVTGAATADTSPGAPAAGGRAEHAAAAQRALRSNASLAGFDLHVQEEGGKLVLRGHVNTPAEKDLSGALAREGAGEPVDNLVEARSAPRQEARVP
jgi:hyperosmotically inducible periplasmic protein